MLTRDSLKDKNAVVTGASRGIGRACAQTLAFAGAHVVVTGRSLESCTETLDLIKAAGGTASFAEMDVSKPESITQAFEGIMSQFKEGIHILVNNAGISKDNLLARVDLPEWEEVMDTNLRGAFLCAKAAFKSLRRNEGTVINISSIVARHGRQGQAAYIASKAGLEGLTLALAQESSGKVRVNAVAPGWITTDMTAGVKEEIRDEVTKRIALNRLGMPEEVAEVVLFLAASANYVNGAIIPVDGGLV